MHGSLTPKQLAFYDREGYLIVGGLLGDADLRPAREAMARKVEVIATDLLEHGLIDDPRGDSPFETRLAELFAGRSDEEFLNYGRGWRDRDPGYFELMANPVILDAVESLIGGEIYANPVYNTRPKVPRVAAGAVPWHQDKSYWPGANANPVITVWVPLVDATLENGCLHVMPRTHRQKLLSYHYEQVTGTRYLELDAEHLGKEKEPLPLPVNKGDVILFNDRCIHCSTPNTSDHVRWAIDLRYQPTGQDPMLTMGVGFLARSRKRPERVATLEDWLDERPVRRQYPPADPWASSPRKRIGIAARRLAGAWQSGTRISGLGDARPRTRAEAYAVQDAVTVLLGLPVAGWKVGAATPAIMRQRGLDEPIPGPLFGPRVYADAATLPAANFPAAYLETEFAIRTLTELPPRRTAYDTAELAAVSELLAAFDLTQSRYSDAPDDLGEIADSGNSGGAVIGAPIPDWRDRDLTGTTVELSVDGGAPVPTYAGDWRRHPLDVFAWLVNSLSRRGIALPAGSVILTGSLTEPHPVTPGSSAVARFDGGAEVRLSIAE